VHTPQVTEPDYILAPDTVAVQALRAWSASQAGERLAAGDGWQDTGLVFTSHLGAALDAGNVRKMFKRICTEAGTGDEWTPRELRTTFVSLMSHHGVSIEEIAPWPGTPPPAPPRSSTAANYDPSSPPAPKSWTSSSPEPDSTSIADRRRPDLAHVIDLCLPDRMSTAKYPLIGRHERASAVRADRPVLCYGRSSRWMHHRDTAKS